MGLERADPLEDIPERRQRRRRRRRAGRVFAAEAAPKKPAKTPLPVDYDTLIQHGMRLLRRASWASRSATRPRTRGGGGGKGQAGDSARETSSEALNRKTNAGLEAYCAGAIDDGGRAKGGASASARQRDAQIQRRRQRERDTREALRRDDRLEREGGGQVVQGEGEAQEGRAASVGEGLGAGREARGRAKPPAREEGSASTDF